MVTKLNIPIIILLLLFFSYDLSAQQIIDQIRYDEKKGYYVIKYHYENDSTKQADIGTLMPGDHVDPGVIATVEKEDTDEFKYSYTIQNGNNAPQALYSFALKTTSSIKEVSSPTSEWDGTYIGWKSEISWVKTGGRIPGIRSGETVSGFSFKSSALPTIMKSYSNNYVWMSFPGEEPVGKLQTIVDSLLENRRHVLIKTIGPRELPDNISHIALVDTLYSYLSFSCDTTWIANRGICRSLETKLRNVQRQLQRGNTRPAAGSLQALLNELNALREKQISSEAYALLYYNGQYLLTKLKLQE